MRITGVVKALKALKIKRGSLWITVLANASNVLNLPPFFWFSNKKQSGFRKVSAEIETTEIFVRMEKKQHVVLYVQSAISAY